MVPTVGSHAVDIVLIPGLGVPGSAAGAADPRRMPVPADDDLRFDDGPGLPRAASVEKRWLRELPSSGAPRIRHAGELRSGAEGLAGVWQFTACWCSIRVSG